MARARSSSSAVTARGRTSGLRFPSARLTPQARDLAARRVAEAAFATSPDAQVVLDRDQQVVLVNETATRRLGVRRQDVGRPFEQLELSYRPVELRSVVERVLDSGRTAELQDVRWSRREAPDTWWDVQVAALSADPDGAIGVQVTFVDVSRYHALTGELTRAHAELQEAYEELQSSSEELETTNEELQSTNEELETTNEELQSTNEELQTVNDEHRERTVEVREVNALLEGVLANLSSGVAVVDLDLDLRILLWNPAAERLWGLRSFEVEGSHLLLLPGGLPVDDLRTLAQPVLDTGTPGERCHVALSSRFGDRVRCTLSADPLRDAEGALRGVVIGMTQRPDGVPQE